MYCFTFLTWLTVLSARKNFFLPKQFRAGNAEVNGKHPVIHLVFPCSFFSSVIVLHSFLNARVFSEDKFLNCLLCFDDGVDDFNRHVGRWIDSFEGVCVVGMKLAKEMLNEEDYSSFVTKESCAWRTHNLKSNIQCGWKFYEERS